jgi:hypothetical protein
MATLYAVEFERKVGDMSLDMSSGAGFVTLRIFRLERLQKYRTLLVIY